jgi:hypothetical protein
MTKQITRRQLLRGIGGVALALPLLPSLLRSRHAEAAATTRKRFVQFCSQHGGVWGPSMYPAATTLTTQMPYADRTVKSGALKATASGPNAVLSTVLTGPSSKLTAQLVGKMNLLRGLDVPLGNGHHTGFHLGNFGRFDGNDGTHFPVQPMTPTIDQLMAWSASFYGAAPPVVKRSLCIGHGCGNMGGTGSHPISWGWSNPQQASGTVQQIDFINDTVALFKQLFTQNNTQATNPRSKPMVDLVLEDYKRLSQSNTRLSAVDRQRLSAHMDSINEIERRLTIQVSCTNVMPGGTDTAALYGQTDFCINPTDHVEFATAVNDLIATAIQCDTTRIVTIAINDTFSSYAGDWHGDIAHLSDLNPPNPQQTTLTQSHQGTFANTFLDLCAKLDVDDGTGKTYLDNSLVVWTQECGEYIHGWQALPIVTAGSAGGFFKTGLYCDYRNPTIAINSDPNNPPGVTSAAGLLWQQWLATALQAMGLSPSEYESNGLHGYPANNQIVAPSAHPASFYYPAQLWTVAGDVLPFLKA